MLSKRPESQILGVQLSGAHTNGVNLDVQKLAIGECRVDLWGASSYSTHD